MVAVRIGVVWQWVRSKLKACLLLSAAAWLFMIVLLLLRTHDDPAVVYVAENKIYFWLSMLVLMPLLFLLFLAVEEFNAWVRLKLRGSREETKTDQAVGLVMEIVEFFIHHKPRK